mgnify:CR=1 FL=1
MRSHIDNSARRLRVLHVLPSLNPGGMERGVVRLLQHAVATPNHGIDHAVCVLRGGDASLLAECRRFARTWQLGELNDDGSLPNRGAWRGLRRVIGLCRPDIVHARSTGVWMDAALATLANAHTRLLLAFHGREQLEPISRLRIQRHRMSVRMADAVLSVSHHAAAMLINEWRIASNRLRVVHDGVDTDTCRPAVGNHEKFAMRARLSLPSDARVAVCVANHVPIKALDVLITAWRQTAMAVPGARLLLVGDGPLRRNLEALSRKLRCEPSVRFLGRREDVPDILRAADLFVLPSHYEGTSNAVQEAMATGLPIVATDVGGMRDVVTPHVTAWLASPGSAEMLALNMINLFNDNADAQAMGDEARKEAVDQFSMDVWLRRHAALYHELALKPVDRAQPQTEALTCAG